jgi:chromosome segregation ATPase
MPNKAASKRAGGKKKAAAKKTKGKKDTKGKGHKHHHHKTKGKVHKSKSKKHHRTEKEKAFKEQIERLRGERSACEGQYKASVAGKEHMLDEMRKMKDALDTSEARRRKLVDQLKVIAPKLEACEAHLQGSAFSRPEQKQALKAIAQTLADNMQRAYNSVLDLVDEPQAEKNLASKTVLTQAMVRLCRGDGNIVEEAINYLDDDRHEKGAVVVDSKTIPTPINELAGAQGAAQLFVGKITSSNASRHGAAKAEMALLAAVHLLNRLRLAEADLKS